MLGRRPAMALHPDATTYPTGSTERAILDKYRTSVERAFGFGIPYIDALSVATIRRIIADCGMANVSVIVAAEAEYMRSLCELIQAPTARPMHT